MTTLAIAVSVLTLLQLYQVAAHFRRPRWKRLGLPDPADEGWEVSGEAIKHKSGLTIGENPGYPKEQHPFLMAGKTVLLGSAKWYARAVVQHAVEHQAYRRLMIEAGEEGLAASQDMEVKSIEDEYLGRSEHGKTLNLGAENGRAKVLIPTADAGLWRVGERVTVTVRRT